MSYNVFMITQEQLKQILNYDPETGIFTWKISPRRAVHPGTVAGSENGHGYRQIFYRGKTYLSHRLAWLYVHGSLPPSDIDHVDGNGLNNAITNLRLCTKTQNMGNRKPNKNNTSGYKGVSWDKRKKKFRAQIRQSGKCKFLGYFDTIEQAAEAYNQAAVVYFGSFANLNHL